MRFDPASLLFLQIIVMASVTFGAEPTGSIRGEVVSQRTQDPVVGAYVIMDGTSFGAITDASGDFTIADIPVGGYSISVTSVGYHSRVKTDIIVRPERTTFIDFSLEIAVISGGTIEVRPEYFAEDDTQPTSRMEFSGEQIRRTPGSAGDVTRVIAGLPSIARVDDQYNGLAVRGGNPLENGFYIDNIEIANINHFPRQGTSGGGLGMVNVDLLESVWFSAGGFSSSYGDRLSSVMELKLREGNREEFDGQIDFSMSGFGAVGEGPIDKGRGSWLASARRSYVDLLVDIADIDAVPIYSDFQAKVVYDLTPSHRLSLLGVGALDYVDYTYEQAHEDGNTNYGITDNWNIVGGLGWRWLWEGEGYSNTTVSFQGISYRGDYWETLSGNIQAVQNSTERALQFRNVNTWQISPMLKMEFGLDGKYRFDRFDNFYAADTNYSGEPIPAVSIRKDQNTIQGGIFTTCSYSVIPSLTLSFGARMDYSDFTDRCSLSPRGSVNWEPADGTVISASAGIYRQMLSTELLSRDADYTDLEEPTSCHAVVGLRQLLADDTRLVVEAYMKRYRNFPYDPSQPGYFVLDGLSSEQDLYAFENLISGAEARATGIEVTFQKRLVSGFYGMLAGSYSVSEYRSPTEEWRRRIFDNRWICTLEGGYRLDRNWEFSCRWMFAGGRPYTPLDLAACEKFNRTILDETRINAERYPDYHSLNIRVDRRFHFSESSLICYASVWNVYNRRNVTATYWNQIDRKEDCIHQWGMMPILGVEFEF